MTTKQKRVLKLLDSGNGVLAVRYDGKGVLANLASAYLHCEIIEQYVISELITRGFIERTKLNRRRFLKEFDLKDHLNHPSQENDAVLSPYKKFMKKKDFHVSFREQFIITDEGRKGYKSQKKK